MKECSPDDVFTKKVFYFTGKDRASLDEISVGSKAIVHVRNKKNEIVAISFNVTRDVHLGSKTRWVYGVVLNSPDGEYRQIEFKLNKDKPDMDTIEVFLQAPPNIINELR